MERHHFGTFPQKHRSKTGVGRGRRSRHTTKPALSKGSDTCCHHVSDPATRTLPPRMPWLTGLDVCTVSPGVQVRPSGPDITAGRCRHPGRHKPNANSFSARGAGGTLQGNGFRSVKPWQRWLVWRRGNDRHGRDTELLLAPGRVYELELSGKLAFDNPSESTKRLCLGARAVRCRLDIRQALVSGRAGRALRRCLCPVEHHSTQYRVSALVAREPRHDFCFTCPTCKPP